MKRDIKGHNIMIEKDGVVKLTDFGTSKKLNIGERETDKDSKEPLSKSLKGSPYWMAPEVFFFPPQYKYIIYPYIKN